MKKIVILGAGAGGTIVANLLTRRLSGWEAKVTLVSEGPRHAYQPGWLYVPFGWTDSRSLSRPVKGLLNKMIEHRVAKVTGIDAGERKVQLAKGENLDYDYLVLATGATLDLDKVAGFRSGAHHFYSESAAHELYSALQDFQGGTIAVATAGGPCKGPAVALEFAYLLDEFLTLQKLREQSKILYMSPGLRCHPVPEVHALAEPMMAEKNIHFLSSFDVERIHRRNGETTVFSHDGREVFVDLLVMVPPHRGADYLQGTGWTEPDGWVKTDPSTLEVEENVWALGDVTALKVAKTGSVAHFQAPVVSEQVLSRVLGSAPDPRYEHYHGQSMCFLETGFQKATVLDSDYERPPAPAAPNRIHHYQKMAFNRAYWYLVPTGIL